MHRNHISFVVIFGVAGLLAALIFASALVVLIVGSCFAIFGLGLILSRWFKPRSTIVGILGLGYAVMIMYEIVVYRGATSVLMGALLVALAIGYVLSERGA